MTQEQKCIDVLDHGFVRLVDYMGDDLSIVRSARVSFDAAWRAGKDAGKDEKLIRFLMRNRHTSPFEAVQFTFEIKCPIFVARQWHRHRTWSYNEISARYTALPEEVHLPDPAVIGAQSSDNKQARDLSWPASEANKALWEPHIAAMQRHGERAFELYHGLLSEGMPRELARSVLPLATYTRFFGSVNLHNLFHFIRLRIHKHAQYEIRVYAAALLELINPIVPVATAAFYETLESDE